MCRGWLGEYHKEVYEAMSRKRIRKIERELSELEDRGQCAGSSAEDRGRTQCLTLRLRFECVAGVVLRSSAVLL